MVYFTNCVLYYSLAGVKNKSNVYGKYFISLLTAFFLINGPFASLYRKLWNKKTNFSDKMG